MTLALAFALAAEPVTLRYRLIEGDVVRRVVVREYRGPANGESLRVEEQVEWRVGPSGDGKLWPVETHARPVRYALDGTELPPPTAELGLVLTESRDVRGQVRDRRPVQVEAVGGGSAERALDIVYLAAPVVVGQTWERSVGFDDTTRTPAAVWRWTLTELTPTAATLAFTFKEVEALVPVTAQGTARIDRATGWPVEMDATVEDTFVPGDEEGGRVSLRVTLRRP